MTLAEGLAFIPVLANDTPASGETLWVKDIQSQAVNGECSISLSLTEVVYMPNDGFTGTDRCTYLACSEEASCDSAELTIVVEPI